MQVPVPLAANDARGTTAHMSSHLLDRLDAEHDHGDTSGSHSGFLQKRKATNVSERSEVGKGVARSLLGRRDISPLEIGPGTTNGRCIVYDAAPRSQTVGHVAGTGSVTITT